MNLRHTGTALAATFSLTGAWGCHADRGLEGLAGATAACAITAAELVAESRAEKQAWTPLQECGGYPRFECYSDSTLPLEDAREHALRAINLVRTMNGARPVSLDFALNAYAQQGSKQLARNHHPHGHVLTDTTGCRLCGESQGDPNGYPAKPVSAQIDAILDDMVAEGAGGTNYDNLLRSDWHVLGIGLVNPDGLMYLTADFSR
jgi:hypothetical protein